MRSRTPSTTSSAATPPRGARPRPRSPRPGPGRHPPRALTIDPLVFATFLGGSGRDESRAIAVGPSGDVYVTGVTASLDFPATPGAVGTSPRGGAGAVGGRWGGEGERAGVG